MTNAHTLASDWPDPITLRSGVEMPALGFGTWRIGEVESEADTETAAIRRAVELGFAHFDTAEMYGDGGSESLLGAALAGVPRDALFLTSKFYPWHASAAQMADCCDATLRRLRTDHLDLYLLHWPGGTPIEETLDGARRLLDAGKIRAFGVSNFDVHEMRALAEQGLDELVDVNQVLYNPARRGVEFDLLPFLREHGIVCMAYTPIEPDLVGANLAFRRIAEDIGLSAAQLALAWHLTRGVAVPIPKAASVAHVEALAAAARLRLANEVLERIDDAFPPPAKAQPLEII